MYLLGISCYSHHSAAALIKDGVLIAAAEEERFSRIKADASFPERSIEFCLKTAGIRSQELDYAVFYEKPFEKFERELASIVQTIPWSMSLFRHTMASWLGRKLWIRAKMMERLDLPRKQILFSEHHVSHAASAFFCSPFDEAAIMTMDGVGEWATGTLGKAQGRRDGSGGSTLEVLFESRFPNSLGLLYKSFTVYLGLGDESQVMALASRGEPRYVDKILKMVAVKEDGSFHMNMSYFAYHYHPRKLFRRKFERLLGPSAGNAADIAASVQQVAEKVLVRSARHLHQLTGCKNLCIAGGVGFNSVANAKILQETPFEDVFVPPAAGNAGGALGAALYAYHGHLQKPRAFVMEHAFYGQEYSEAEIEAALNGLPCERLDEDRLLDRTVQALTQGKKVGWFHGRFEWGPHALGHRSILVDPRRENESGVLSVPAECAGEIFEQPKGSSYPLRFNLMAVKVKESFQGGHPSTVQTVHAETNPLYHKLIRHFGRATGISALLNAPLRIEGEPMAASPQDAVSVFKRGDCDALAMTPFWVSKS